MKPLGKVLRYLKKHWLTSLGACVSLLLATGANLVSPRRVQLFSGSGRAGGICALAQQEAPPVVSHTQLNHKAPSVHEPQRGLVFSRW